MRIGVTGLRGLPNVMGGIESHAEQLYPRLYRLRPDREIEVTERKPYVDATRRSFDGLRLWPLYAIRNKYFETILHTAWALVFLRLRRGCRVVHIHAIGPGLLAPLARMLGMRVVITHHGRDYDRAKWNRVAKSLLQLGERVAVGVADEVIVVSDTVAQKLRKDYPHRGEHIHAIPNGASLVFSQGSREPNASVLAKFGLERDGFILAVGRLVPEKGLHDLIAAFEASGDPRKLVIAGAADHADSYAQGLLAKQSDRVIFAGYQPHETLRSLYAGASLFVLASYHEGLPIAALEAIAMARPVLLSDIPANLEIELPPANYFRTGDVEELARKLRDPAVTANNYPSMTARFDWDKIAVQTNIVFDLVCDDAVPRGAKNGAAA